MFNGAGALVQRWVRGGERSRFGTGGGVREGCGCRAEREHFPPAPRGLTAVPGRDNGCRLRGAGAVPAAPSCGRRAPRCRLLNVEGESFMSPLPAVVLPSVPVVAYTAVLKRGA